jgi:membrane protease YdiL (CAAX protease family)
LFALAHLNLPTILPLFALALMLTYIYEKTDNLFACIYTHAAFNAANVIYLYYQQN